MGNRARTRVLYCVLRTRKEMGVRMCAFRPARAALDVPSPAHISSHDGRRYGACRLPSMPLRMIPVLQYQVQRGKELGLRSGESHDVSTGLMQILDAIISPEPDGGETDAGPRRANGPGALLPSSPAQSLEDPPPSDSPPVERSPSTKLVAGRPPPGSKRSPNRAGAPKKKNRPAPNHSLTVLGEPNSFWIVSSLICRLLSTPQLLSSSLSPVECPRFAARTHLFDAPRRQIRESHRQLPPRKAWRCRGQPRGR